jgi:hypothetical protein
MFIPDPGVGIFFIPDPGSASKNLSILTPKIVSSRKYDPASSSRIRILIFYPSRIPDPQPKHWWKDIISLRVAAPINILALFRPTIWK